jgi:hypothetical protein
VLTFREGFDFYHMIPSLNSTFAPKPQTHAITAFQPHLGCKNSSEQQKTLKYEEWAGRNDSWPGGHEDAAWEGLCRLFGCRPRGKGLLSTPNISDNTVTTEHSIQVIDIMPCKANIFDYLLNFYNRSRPAGLDIAINLEVLM